jgi:hypothetical protein
MLTARSWSAARPLGREKVMDNLIWARTVGQFTIAVFPAAQASHP